MSAKATFGADKVVESKTGVCVMTASKAGFLSNLFVGSERREAENSAT
jgi:hypothetical protein